MPEGPSYDGHDATYTPRTSRPPLRGAAPERSTSGLWFVLAITLAVTGAASAGVAWFDRENRPISHEPPIPVPMSPLNAEPSGASPSPAVTDVPSEPGLPPVTKAKVRSKKRTTKPRTNAAPTGEAPVPTVPPSPYDRI